MGVHFQVSDSSPRTIEPTQEEMEAADNHTKQCVHCATAMQDVFDLLNAPMAGNVNISNRSTSTLKAWQLVQDVLSHGKSGEF